MTSVLLIRHGNNDWLGKRLAGWLPGVHLNEEGRGQAGRLAQRLAGARLAAIWSSPLDRARETAAPLAARHGIDVQVSEDFGEIRMGEWTGREIASLEEDPVWRRFNAFRGGTRCPGGEHMLEVQQRMVKGIEWLRERHPDSAVAIVSHADPIRAALAHYAGIPLDLCLRVNIDPASVTAVRIGDWGPRIACVNGTGEVTFC